MTLPAISPVILFAVIIGVIHGLQYFTQAYVAARSRRPGVAGRLRHAVSMGYPEGSTLFYPVLLTTTASRLLPHGVRPAMAMLMLVGLIPGHAADRLATCAGGCTSRSGM